MANVVKLTKRGMPMIGLGTWKSAKGEVCEAVKIAIDCGYRHIDCAYGYGNEAEVGEGIAAKISEGVVKREDIFVVSKLWNTRHAKDLVKNSVKESLELLGLDYLDLYFIHWPHSFKSGPVNFPKDAEGNVIYDDIHYMETYKVLEDCVDEGLIKAIGLSNFNSEQVQDVINNSRVKPTAIQVEIHPYFANTKLVNFCQERGLDVTAYSPLGSADRPGIGPNDPTLLEEPKLKEIGEKYGKSPAQVVLRWLLQRDITIIPKSVTPKRIVENFQIMDFNLNKDDMDVMNALDTNLRLVAPWVYKDGQRFYRDWNAVHFPFKIEF